MLRILGNTTTRNAGKGGAGAVVQALKMKNAVAESGAERRPLLRKTKPVDRTQNLQDHFG